MSFKALGRDASTESIASYTKYGMRKYAFWPVVTTMIER
jgi:hypothetical protein